MNLADEILEALYEDADNRLDMDIWLNQGRNAHAGQSCGTTACLAGWAVVLAGNLHDYGEEHIEEQARDIYQHELGEVPSFVSSNGEALDWLMDMAEHEFSQVERRMMHIRILERSN